MALKSATVVTPDALKPVDVPLKFIPFCAVIIPDTFRPVVIPDTSRLVTPIPCAVSSLVVKSTLLKAPSILVAVRTPIGPT